MTRLLQILMGLGVLFGISLTVSGDTLYLDDGSVLIGLIIEDTPNDCIITNVRYGDLRVLKSHILYQESDTPVDRMETFTITREATTVLSRIQHPLPDLTSDTTSFKLLVPGEVKAITDSHGLEIPITTRVIGHNTLVTLNTLDLAQDTTTLIATSLQDDMVQPAPSGHLAFKANYIPNQAQTIRVILKFPKTFKLQTISPEPLIQLDGLIVWEQTLNRQQTFAPCITFTP